MKKTIASQAEDVGFILYDLRQKLTDLMRNNRVSDADKEIMKYWVADILNAEGTLAIISAEIEKMIIGERK